MPTIYDDGGTASQAELDALIAYLTKQANTNGFAAPTVDPAVQAIVDGTNAPGAPDPGDGTADQPDYSAGQEEILNNYLAQLGQAQAQKQRRGAASAALQANLDALLGFGSESLARGVLGKALPELNKYLETPYDATDFYTNLAKAHPLSTTGQLDRQDTADTRNTLEGANLANVYYGTAGQRAVGDNAYGQQVRRQSAEQQLLAALGGANSNFLSALGTADQTELDAQQQAYNDIVQRKLALGGVPAPSTSAPQGGGSKSTPGQQTTVPLWKPTTVKGPVAPQSIPYLSQGYLNGPKMPRYTTPTGKKAAPFKPLSGQTARNNRY